MNTTLKRSGSALAVRLFLLLFLVDTIYATLILGFLALGPPTDYYIDFVALLWAVHTAKYLVITFILLRILLGWLSESYEVQDKHLSVRTGVYAVSEKVYELDQLKQVKVHQDWLGRLFRYGNLTLEISASGFHDTIQLKDVAAPMQYEKQLVTAFV